jgi:hypothetical protein
MRFSSFILSKIRRWFGRASMGATGSITTNVVGAPSGEGSGDTVPSLESLAFLKNGNAGKYRRMAAVINFGTEDEDAAETELLSADERALLESYVIQDRWARFRIRQRRGKQNMV